MAIAYSVSEATARAETLARLPTQEQVDRFANINCHKSMRVRWTTYGPAATPSLPLHL